MSQKQQFQWSSQTYSSPSQLEPPSQSLPLSQNSSMLQSLYNTAYSSPVQQSQWNTQREQVPQCRQCGKELSALEQLACDKHAPCCQTCGSQSNQPFQRFRATFLEVTRSATVGSPVWAALQQCAAQERLALSEALAFIRKDVLELVERVVVEAEANNGVTEEVVCYVSDWLKAILVSSEELELILQRLSVLTQHSNIQRFQHAMAQIELNGEVTDATQRYMLQLQQTLAIPAEVAQPVFERLAYLKKLTNIRQGKLPKIKTKMHLDADEICHLEVPTIYHKVNLKTTVLMEGRLVATSKKLVFLSPIKGMTMSWTNIMNIEVRSLASSESGVYLELAKGVGNGLYAVSDPTYVGTVLDVLVKIAKFNEVSTKTDIGGRYIPHDVKVAVWQRDGGRCVQCGATNDLEFDHIIPHAKGGANTIGNVQLLCRHCNLKKSDRI